VVELAPFIERQGMRGQDRTAAQDSEDISRQIGP
jgi:hypothetical protein